MLAGLFPIMLQWLAGQLRSRVSAVDSLRSANVVRITAPFDSGASLTRPVRWRSHPEQSRVFGDPACGPPGPGLGPAGRVRRG